MSMYQIGRDVEELRHRLNHLETGLRGGCDDCGAVQGVVTAPSDFTMADDRNEMEALSSPRLWWWRWSNAFTLKDSTGRDLVEISRLRANIVGWINGDGNKEAYIYVGGASRDLISHNWHMCVNASVRQGAGLYGPCVGQIVVSKDSSGIPFAAFAYPFDQIAANIWYDAIRSGITIEGPLFNCRGLPDSIPLACRA